MEQVKNLHAVSVKYLGPTNTQGSRYKMTSERFGDSITLSYDYSHNNVHDMAVEWLQGHGQRVVGTAETKSGSTVLLDDIGGRFMPLNTIKNMVQNCGAGCTACSAINAHYTIENGNYMYTCLSCGAYGRGAQFTNGRA
jgi:hypothetical protein